ncbi:MAG: IPT/TIG domain-containing protein [Planctomycetota bacterium]|jgi:hypothetical protein
MNRKMLLFIVPVGLLLLLAAAWVFLLPEDTETDPIIGRGDSETAADSVNSGVNLPDDEDADSGNDGENAKGSGGGGDSSKTEVGSEAESETSGSSGIDPEFEAGEKPVSPVKNPKKTSEPGKTNSTPEGTERSLPVVKRRPHPLKKNGRPRNQNVGNRRPRSHTIKNAAGVKTLDGVSEKLKQDRRGLFAKYYRFSDNPINVLMNLEEPELDTRKPDLVRIDRQVNFPSKEAWDDLPFDKSNMMAVWTGFLVVEKPADYWLFLGCDLNGRVELDGQTILLDEHRDYTEVSTVVKLEPGLHPLRIEYVEAKNGSPVEALGSCNFMWVPEGASKPVPVPVEMLLLPEELWSDDAPIITKLSKTSGKIGDEITIHGQGFGHGSEDDPYSFNLHSYAVAVSGVNATILSRKSNNIRIKIPIGAVNGKIIVYWQDNSILGLSSGVHRTIPSNSFDFTVTNQFGLIADWHNLEGWSHFDFLEPGDREAEVTQLENPPTFETRESLNLEFKQNPMACIWTGKLGVPTNWNVSDTGNPDQFILRFQAFGRLRVKLGEQFKTTAATTGETNNLTALDFELTIGEEKYLPLQIDWVNEGGPASMQITLYSRPQQQEIEGKKSQEEMPWTVVQDVPAHLFFPPIVPPTPPQIVLVTAALQEGEDALVLPYTPTTTRPSIREGQECHIEVKNRQQRRDPQVWYYSADRVG